MDLNDTGYEISKKSIRKNLIDCRNHISELERESAKYKLVDAVIKDPLYQNSSNVLLFASYGTEIDTWSLFDKALIDGKCVYLPKTYRDYMLFYRVYVKNELNVGYKGILEPDESGKQWDAKDAGNTVMIMPGLGFDLEGNRIGYGGGFYDRFLSGNNELIGRTIAVGFSCQLIDRVPIDNNDIKPNKIILV